VLKQYEEALADFNAALEFGDAPLAYSGRGDVYYWLGNYEQAVENYQTSLSLYPYNAHCHCFLALTYFELERYQDVFDEAQKANDVDPACGGTKLVEVQARSYYALEDYDQALVYIDRALALEQYALGYYYRGVIYQALGRKQEAIRDLEFFLSVSKSSLEELEENADAEARLKQLKE
jgi:tetratricopeptide (TPR) repeat protein